MSTGILIPYWLESNLSEFCHYAYNISEYQTRCPKNTVRRFSGCCGGAADSIVMVFTQLHWPGLDLEFLTLFESI